MHLSMLMNYTPVKRVNFTVCTLFFIIRREKKDMSFGVHRSGKDPQLHHFLLCDLGELPKLSGPWFPHLYMRV